VRNKAKKTKHGIVGGTKVQLLEDQFGRIVLQPITEDYLDRVMGWLGKGADLLAAWAREHREEGEASVR
jgi:hypothetical protein